MPNGKLKLAPNVDVVRSGLTGQGVAPSLGVKVLGFEVLVVAILEEFQRHPMQWAD
jgi:hypothetical protein